MTDAGGSAGPLRVVVTGAECTGKTVLTRALADRFGVPWVGDFAREYLEEKRRVGSLDCDEHDVLVIAGRQSYREDRVAEMPGTMIVCDGDAFSVGVWHEDEIGRRCDPLIELAERRQPDLYLLTDPEGIPYVSDGIHSGPDHREKMHLLFEKNLVESGRKHVKVTGTEQERLDQAVAAVTALLEGRSA